MWIQSWNVLVILLLVVMGYFIGNVQTAIIVSKIAFRDDVRNHGSGNAGSTNMVRVYGTKYGIITFIGDASKTAIAFVLGRLIGGWLGLHASDAALAVSVGGCLAAAASVYGHCFPVLYGFRGGKAAACSFAIMWCFCWQAALAATVCLVVIFLITKRVSIVSILTATLFTVFVVIAHLIGWIPRYYIWYTLSASGLLIVRHRENIKRILKGEEKELHFSAPPQVQKPQPEQKQNEQKTEEK
ncbi:MAG: glycerol-3-phosphate acyltransferase [Clostridia bacterium]|nr:glycerol-3-phosphate acyltransferase [Clostridia bacterium]